MCGTLDYIAPEILDRSYDKSVDIWCIGVLIFELLHGKPPFEECTEEGTITRIKQINMKFPAHFSAEAIDLIQRILVEAESRIGLEDILRHPFTVRNA
jgi:serine/threonine protein kinase